MDTNPKRLRELTQREVERLQERHFRRVWPYYERLQAQWILEDLDRQRGKAKGLKATGKDD